MSLSTYSGLGEDGLGLGFLGRNHWTLLTISTKTELLNTQTFQKLISLFGNVYWPWLLFRYLLELNYTIQLYLLAALAWYQGALANHQHQADQHDQEDPAIQMIHCIRTVKKKQ